jgi:hypothetical protein
MGVLKFVGAIVWGALSAQFLVQTVTSFIIAIIYVTGLACSKVAKSHNAIGSAVSVAQVVVFAALFYGGNWLSIYFVNYDTWNAASIAGLLSFLLGIVYGALQVPGKLLVARMAGWRPYFMEASMTVPAHERVAFARKCQAEQGQEPTMSPR